MKEECQNLQDTRTVTQPHETDRANLGPSRVCKSLRPRLQYKYMYQSSKAQYYVFDITHPCSFSFFCDITASQVPVKALKDLFLTDAHSVLRRKIFDNKGYKQFQAMQEKLRRKMHSLLQSVSEPFPSFSIHSFVVIPAPELVSFGARRQLLMPRILLAGDANRLVAELTFVRINDLAVGGLKRTLLGERLSYVATRRNAESY